MFSSRRAIFHSSIVIALLASASSAFAARPANPANGTVYQGDAAVEVWHANTGEWVGAEAFWLDYGATGGGKFWGRASEYPPYSEASEHDTLLIEVQGGPCLMYFFHDRWRRAQDVKRWDPAFNEVLGCSHVFD